MPDLENLRIMHIRQQQKDLLERHLIEQQRKPDEQRTTEISEKNVAGAAVTDAEVAKAQLSKKTKNCPTPTVMATPTKQTMVQSKAMYILK